MRVNCAHDTELEWDSMIRHVKRANEETGKRCRVLMDLAGPKLRTGPIHRSFHVIRWRVERNVRGAVIEPARIMLAARNAGETDPSRGGVTLTVPEALVSAAERGDTFRVRDCRGKTRKLTVTEKAQNACTCTCDRGGYVLRGAEITLLREGSEIDAGHVGDLPPVEEPIRLRTGDQLILYREGSQLSSVQRRLPHVTCTPEEVFSKVAAGQPIFFDDGKIEGRIHEVQPDYMVVEILHAGTGEAKLGSAKGINLPETDLGIPAMTAKDRQDLDFIAAHADMVGMSFVNNPQDVVDLQGELAARGKTAMGIILKIETRSGFERLPMIMIAALRHHPAGIMVARGDLAVEVGFERLAEVQEEILWLSEAAHMPVIWATQVLETLAKTGMPSRAEVTDAAMGVRAECVMLNKGEHIVDAVVFLDHILHRMKAHHLKKRSMLRRLAVAQISHAGTATAGVSQ
jgi:pyruvate kinase